MKKNLAIVALLALVALLCGCSSQPKPSSNFEYPSLEDIHQTNLEAESMYTRGYGSIDEALEAREYGFSLYRLHNGRFYPLEWVNDRVGQFDYRDLYGSAHSFGFIVRDAESLPEIRLSDGDQLVCIEYPQHMTLYPGQFMDGCSSVYFASGGQYNSSNYMRDTDNAEPDHDESLIRLSEINGQEVTETEEISNALREAGFRPEELGEFYPTIVVCGEYGDSFTAGGYDGVQYREYRGVIDHNFYRADNKIDMGDLLELTKGDYAIIDLSNIPSGVCVIRHLVASYTFDTYAFVLRNE